MTRLAALFPLVVLAVAPAWGGVITTYTSAAAWDAAVGNNYVTEPFNATGLQPFTGVTTTAGQIGAARGVLTGSVWTDRVDPGGATTTFAYKPGTVFGAGATWDTSPGGEGTALLIVDLVGGGQTVAQIGPIDGTFFGWTSTVPFQSFEIASGTNGGVAETFDMDNLQFATDTLPEPSGFAIGSLVGAAGIAFGCCRGKRNASRSTGIVA
ncbi:MAG: hypothetical protein ABR915_10630 [Thermoguttaceae bacterium]